MWRGNAFGRVCVRMCLGECLVRVVKSVSLDVETCLWYTRTHSEYLGQDRVPGSRS